MNPWVAGSPGTGTTAAKLSAEPLATEGEATPGPDDVNPFEDHDLQEEALAYDEDVPSGNVEAPSLFGGLEPQFPDF